jgi:hypothetical protein
MFFPEDTSIDSSIKNLDDNMSDTSSEYSENMDNTILSVSSENSETSEPVKTCGEQFSQDIMILADHIRKHFEKSNTYVFRCVKIDGIYCCCVVYRDEQIVNIESVRVLVKNAEGGLENYSLHFDHYDTVENAIELVQKIVTTYKLYNGDLYSPEDYEHLIAEESIIPFSDNQRCSVCKIHTTDITNCSHYICFRCREQSLFSGDKHCPTCNKSNVLNMYHNDANIINNYHYNDLVSAIKSDNLNDEENMVEDEVIAPAEQLIAKQLHNFVVNNPGVINAISEFMNIFNKFVGNP